MPPPSRARAEELLRARIILVLNEHGTADLFPLDEFECCVDEIVALFEPINAVVSGNGEVVCNPVWDSGIARGQWWGNLWRLREP